MTSPHATTGGIGERFSPPDASFSLHEHLLYHRHRFAYEQSLPLIAGKKTVEIGCGSAYGTELLTKSAAFVSALDTDAGLIEVLQQKAAPAMSSLLKFQSYDGKTLPFPNASVEAIVSFQVIEHVEDDLRFLQEIKRVLKPAAVAVLTTPNRLVRLLKGQKPFNNYHYREYAPQELLALAKEAGLSARVAGIFGGPETQALELKRLKKYHTWQFRYLFQPIPRQAQMNIKKIALLASRMIPRQQREVLPQFSYFRSSERVSESLDLWVELSA